MLRHRMFPWRRAALALLPLSSLLIGCHRQNALIRKDGETPLFDGLGSERTVTNSSGAVQGTLTPSAFGQTVASTGSSTSAYQYGAISGYRTEGDAGLTLVGCRSYDAQVGRFITRDTYLDQAPYAYCDGDPVNAVDPSGHAPPRGKGGGEDIYAWVKMLVEEIIRAIKTIIGDPGFHIKVKMYPNGKLQEMTIDVDAKGHH